MDGLTEYRVSLHEDRGDKFTIFFDCWANDEDHAEEQAMNAYPNGEIVNVTQIWDGSPDPNDPDNYWIDDQTGERVNATTGERTKP